MKIMTLFVLLIGYFILAGCEKENNSNSNNHITTITSINEQAKAVGLGGNLPNIVLIMVDDMGWGDTGYNGHAWIQTPNLDTMADNSLVFNRFYAAAPVCSPTRGSVMTGRHPYRYGVYYANVGHLPEEEITLAEVLKEQGYRTGFFGKWHLGTFTTTELDSNRGGRAEHREHYSPPWLHGFDVVFSTESKVPTYDPMIKPTKGYQKTWWDPVTMPVAGEPFGTAYWNTNGQKEMKNLSGDDSRVIVDRAVPFIRNTAGSGKPFFVVIWLHSPHLPVVAADSDTAVFAEQDKFTQHYYGTIKALDREVGRIRTTLVEMGVADNTLLWFTSDNGPEHHPDFVPAPGSSGGLRGAKRSLYEGGIRVPGIVEWPNVVKVGRKTNTIAITSDILPTIVDVLGVAATSERPMDGISLKQVILGEEIDRPIPIAFESAYQLALIDQRYKLIHQPDLAEASTADPNLSSRATVEDIKAQPLNINTAGQNPALAFQYELYDLNVDFKEAVNLAEKYPEVVKEMSNKLQAWRHSVSESLAGKDYE